MDRWHIDSSDPTIDLPLNVMNNYFSIGVDAAACLKFHSERGRFITRVTQNFTEAFKDVPTLTLTRLMGFGQKWTNKNDVLTLKRLNGNC